MTDLSREELKQSQQKWDGTIRFLMNCFAAFCGILVLLCALYGIYGGDPARSYIDTPQSTEDGIAVSLFNQSRSGMVRYEFLLLVEETENMPELTTRQFSHFRVEQLVTRLEVEGVVITGMVDLSGMDGRQEVAFNGLQEGQAYILLAPKIADGHILDMETQRIRYEPEGREVE